MPEPVVGLAIITAVLAMFGAGISLMVLWKTRRRSVNCCAMCGYPVAGLLQGRCPECGAALAAIDEFGRLADDRLRLRTRWVLTWIGVAMVPSIAHMSFASSGAPVELAAIPLVLVWAYFLALAAARSSMQLPPFGVRRLMRNSTGAFFGAWVSIVAISGAFQRWLETAAGAAALALIASSMAFLSTALSIRRILRSVDGVR